MTWCYWRPCAACVQAQLAVLEIFCQCLSLTVNLVKTKVMLLAEERSSRAAVSKGERGASALAGSKCLW